MLLQSTSIVCALLLIGVIDLAFYVPAFIYGLEGDPSCATSYPGINFTYASWLYYFGLMGFIHLSVLLLAVIVEVVIEPIGALCGYIFFVLYAVWGFAWYIVGAVLLFETLANSECQGQHMWKFGLALFVIQTFFMCIRAKMTRDKE